MLYLNISQLPSPDKGLFVIEKIRCKKPFDPEKSGGGYILKSGFVKNMRSRNFAAEGGGGGKGDLEKSRLDWVFLNVGLPK